jgi:cyanophycin synthetase
MVDLADEIRLGPSSRAILRAATARGIPYFRLNAGSLVQFGEGAYQRRTWTAETDATSAIAESIASDKQLTRSILEAVGVNVPRGRSVASREDAWQAALEVGVPVAVKPRNANHAVGVSLDLSDQEAVMAGYDWACQAGHTTDVLVEQYIHGDHHRLLVIDGKFAAAAKGQREYVYGDGVSTITELVAQLNRDPRRGENYTDQLQVLKLDAASAIELRKQDLDFQSIPKKGRQVLIEHVGDLIEDCTDRVHPTTRQVAILAAKTIGLDIAGMDVVATDISKPLTEQRGCIIEVNAGPSLTPHVAPLIGSPRPVGEAVVELLFPGDRQSTIPTMLFLQCEELSGCAEELGNQMQSLGHQVGLASEGRGPANTWPIRRSLNEYRSLLMHPQLTASIIEVSPATLAKHGLLCEHLSYAVIGKSALDQLSNASRKSDLRAAIDTIAHVLEVGGSLVIVGGSDGSIKQVSELFRIDASRIAICSDRLSLLNQLKADLAVGK